MDSNMILTWSITILAIIFLILFIQKRNKKRGKEILSVLQSFAKDNNGEISSYDRWDKTLIGIDNSEINKLFFIRTISDKEFREVINLSEVKKCRLIKTERIVRYNKENVSVIDKIELIFSFVSTHKPDIALEFYNNEYDSLTLSGQLQLAQKWSGIVEAILNTVKNRNSEVGKVKVDRTSFLKEPTVHVHTPAYAVKRKVKYPNHGVIVT